MNLTIESISPLVGAAYLLALVVSAIVACILARQEETTRARWTIGLLILVVAVGTLVFGFARYTDCDEIEHLHSSWLMSQGQLPYMNFWQHHSPTLWLLLSPIAGSLPHNGLTCDFARVLSLLVSIAAWLLAIRLASRLHGASRGLTFVM